MTKGEDVFIKITNKDIYEKLENIEEHLRNLNGSVKFHRKWLLMMSSIFGSGFLFILSILLRS